MNNHQLTKFKLESLQKGSTLDYNFKNWKVQEIYHYTYDDNKHSQLFLVSQSWKVIDRIEQKNFVHDSLINQKKYLSPTA